MKAQIDSTHHTVQVDELQIDVFYHFTSALFQVFIDGEHYHTSTLHPSRNILSYTNIVDISTTYAQHYNRRKEQQAKQQQLEQEK